MTIYLDILLLLNWWIDYLLLLGVRRVMGGGGRPWRLALGGLIGALSCLILFAPPLPVVVTLLLKLVTAVCMVLVAFRWQGLFGLCRRTLLLFTLSAGLAGLCGALYFFVAPQGFYVVNGVVYYAVPPLLLVGLTVVCYGLLTLSDWLTRRRAPRQHTFTVEITEGDRRVSFLCLYDTGNHLVEPFSGYPVLVLERDVAEQLRTIPASVEEVPPGEGWRLIPYETVGGGGLLPAFIPTKVVIHTKTVPCALDACYVAVCPRLGRGEYRGLMGAEMGEGLV